VAKYQQTPEYIEAFQLTAETAKNTSTWPEWAIKNSELDNRKVGAIFPTDPDDPNGEISIRTEYGVFPVPIGDWIVERNGTYMIMQDIHFQASFVESTDASKKAPSPKPEEVKEPAKANNEKGKI
jgi:hypothetical protein